MRPLHTSSRFHNEGDRIHLGVYDHNHHKSGGEVIETCHRESCGHSRFAIAVGLRHRVPIRSAILAIIHTVGGIPCLIIHRAVLALWDSVLGEYVGVEEYLEMINCRKGSYGEKGVRMT